MRETWDVAVRGARGRRPPVSRVAYLSVHTCPLDQPGTGDSGGMNVYVRQVTRRLAEMGVSVDIFTRASGQRDRVSEIAPGVRVVHLEAGPERPVPKDELASHLCEFLYSLLRFEAGESGRFGGARPSYDVVHGHYWLSGWVGRLAAERWEVPLVHSFHTLGRVKNATRVPGDAPEPGFRIGAEERIVHTAECVLAPTVAEAADLVRLYGARPDRVRVVAPGVDTDVFRPAGPDARAAAKAALGFEGRALVLFVGRLQLLKAPEVALRALAELVATEPSLDPVLLLLGGPSGNAGIQPETLEKLAAELGIAERVRVHDPVPHHRLPQYYRAADAVIVPSRSESFGLVALEASACGTPVVATDVGGLRTAVRDGVTGLLVPGGGPFAAALGEVLTDPARAAAMGEAGARLARRYDWRRAAAGLIEVYEDEVARAERAATLA